MEGGGGNCSLCGGTGYKGRIALYEVMVITDAIKELILNGASSMEIKEQAIRDGMNSLRMSGINKIADGVTTVDEVLRVTAKD
jgi:type IV pilus assembly protein PilB